MTASGKRADCRGFTLIELLVVIAIIAILAAILFPVFAAVKKKGLTTTCGSNLSQIGKACIMYANDHNGRMPLVADIQANGTPSASAKNSAWRSANGPYIGLNKYVKSDKVFKCPGPECSNCFQNGTRIEVDYRFNELMGEFKWGIGFVSKSLGACTQPSRFYVVSDRHSRHHYERGNSTQGQWIMLMVMADTHLTHKVRPYGQEWVDSRGGLKYNHWDFPSCHTADAQVVNEY